MASTSFVSRFISAMMETFTPETSRDMKVMALYAHAHPGVDMKDPAVRAAAQKDFGKMSGYQIDRMYDSMLQSRTFLSQDVDTLMRSTAGRQASLMRIGCGKDSALFYAHAMDSDPLFRKAVENILSDSSLSDKDRLAAVRKAYQQVQEDDVRFRSRIGTPWDRAGHALSSENLSRYQNDRFSSVVLNIVTHPDKSVAATLAGLSGSQRQLFEQFLLDAYRDRYPHKDLSSAAARREALDFMKSMNNGELRTFVTHTIQEREGLFLSKGGYKTYPDEPLNPRMHDAKMRYLDEKGGTLLVAIDGRQHSFEVSGDLYKAWESGALPTNVLANRLLDKYDQEQRVAMGNSRYDLLAAESQRDESLSQGLSR